MRPMCVLGLTLTAAMGASGSGQALELMTGDGYLLALAQGEAERAAADNYLGGTLDSLIVLNEMLAAEESPLFCLSEERASVLDDVLLREEFTDWLKATPSGSSGEEQAGTLPVPLLGWAFLARKFPCAPSAQGDADAELRARLRESVPK